jgi:2-methylfumaryl-CoA isomerase
MTLAQLGADIVRVDPLGGAADHHRWPISATGTSLYWMALNKGKRSVTIDFRSPAGRELVVALATESSQDAGIVVENNVGRPWLSYAALSERRPDMIQLHIQGQSDGRPAVDYTVNAEVGIPDITGPDGLVGPVNHVLPAWDLLTGTTAATGLLAALLRRDRTGCGANLEIALADVALAGVASLGWLAEADELGTDRPRQGNHVYGSFGVDFTTEDGHRVMVVALTVRHWDALRTVTGTAKVFAALEEAMSVDLAADGDRYRLREMVAAVLRPWFAARPLREVGRKLDEAGVLWSRYRSMTETVSDFRSGKSVPVLAEVTQPGIGQMLSTRSPIRLDAAYGDAHPAPRLGQHTDEVLADVLGLNDHQIGRLHDRRVIGATV